MRKTSIAGVVLTCGTIITLGWQLGSQGNPANPVAAEPTTSTTVAAAEPVKNTQVSQPSTSQPTTTPSSTAAQPATNGEETVSGDSVSTRFGSVQVSVKFNGSTIEDITALKLTDADRKSVSISNRAAPLLKASVLKSQSANVDTISGATYTSDAYLKSLQSAIDKHNA